MKLKEQITKALECCGTNNKRCSSCPLATDYSPCSKTMAENALALIKELAEKVENYRQELGKVRVALAEANNDKKKLSEENERSRADVIAKEVEYDDMLHQRNSVEQHLETAVADTVSKMRSMIKEKCIRGGIYPAFVKGVVERVAEEILEENNAHQMEQAK